MKKRTIQLHRWYVKQNPATHKTLVHLHGIEKKFLSKTNLTENYQLSYIANETTGASVRRAMQASPNLWKIGFLAARANGI